MERGSIREGRVEAMGESLVRDRSEQPWLVMDVRLDDMGLDTGAFRVYAHLVRMAEAAAEMPALRAICERCRMSNGGVQRAIARLEEMGMVRVVRRSGRNGNQYVITAPSAWVAVEGAELSSGVNVVAFPDNMQMGCGESGEGGGEGDDQRMYQMEIHSEAECTKWRYIQDGNVPNGDTFKGGNVLNGDTFSETGERGEGGGACTLYVPSSTPQNIKNMYPLPPLEEVSNGAIEGVSSEIENNNQMADLPLFGGEGDGGESEKEEGRRVGPVYSDGFLAFWSAYPKKVGKRAAWVVWQRGRLEAIGYDIVKSIDRHAEGRRWMDGFIPDPRTFLNQGRWEDAVEVSDGGCGRREFDDVRGGNGLDEL